MTAAWLQNSELSPEQIRDLAIRVLDEAITELARAGVPASDLATALVAYAIHLEISLTGAEGASRLLDLAREHLLAVEAADPTVMTH